MDNPMSLATLGTQDMGRRPMSYVPSVASDIGLSILGCPFGFL
jgi:hypothetical protein